MNSSSIKLGGGRIEIKMNNRDSWVYCMSDSYMFGHIGVGRHES